MFSRQVWPLPAAVLGLAEQASQSPAPVLAAAGRSAADRLQKPLQVALMGLVPSGKSTLFNAILETKMAPAAPGECTPVLYQFSHDRFTSFTSALAILRNDSGLHPVAVDGQGLSRTLPAPTEEIQRIEVTLHVYALEHVTLVGTPGLDSTNSEISEVTKGLLQEDTLGAAGRADAIIFCLNTPSKDAEAEAGRLFATGRAGMGLSGGTAVGVLTKADYLGTDWRTAWKSVVEMAYRLSTLHADLFTGVMPVVGLLAETARTGALPERHAYLLGDLARTWSSDESDVVLSNEEISSCRGSPRVFAVQPHSRVTLRSAGEVSPPVDCCRRWHYSCLFETKTIT